MSMMVANNTCLLLGACVDIKSNLVYQLEIKPSIGRHAAVPSNRPTGALLWSKPWVHTCVMGSD